MNKIKSLLAVSVMLGVSFSALGQGSLSGAPPVALNSEPVIVSLPFTFLSPATTTNISAGWSVNTISTNVQTAWSTSTAAFVTTTNYVTNTVTKYADFSARGQRWVPLQCEFKTSDSTNSPTAVLYTVAFSVNGINYGTVGRQTFGWNHTTNVTVVGITNMDMMGFPFGRIISVQNAAVDAYVTNGGVYAVLSPRNGK